jgi:hypothetical protein
MCARSRSGALLTAHPTADTEGGYCALTPVTAMSGPAPIGRCVPGLAIRRMVRRPARCSTMRTTTGHGDPSCSGKIQPTRSRPSTVTGPL